MRYLLCIVHIISGCSAATTYAPGGHAVAVCRGSARSEIRRHTAEVCRRIASVATQQMEEDLCLQILGSQGTRALHLEAIPDRKQRFPIGRPPASQRR